MPSVREHAAAPVGRSQGTSSLALAIVSAEATEAKHVAAVLAEDGLAVAIEARDPQELVESCDGSSPDAAVLVWRDFNISQTAWFQRIREGLPGTKIIGVASAATPRALRASLDAGADGFVLEAQVEGGLAPSVRAVCSGQLAFPGNFRRYVSRPSLSVREKQILGMVVLGFTNGEIARKLFLAESTVKSHLSSSFVKLGVRSRNDAAALILDPETGLGMGILAISNADDVLPEEPGGGE